MMSYEGEDVARRLKAMGIDAFVLKYRLGHSGPNAPAMPEVMQLAADDGRQAIKVLREKATEFAYQPDRIGMIGYSAGGMVTADALFGPVETRPNFAAIIYGAREVKEVPTPTPPLFLAVAADDTFAVGRTIDLFTTYRRANGSAEPHVFQMGAHGFVNKGGGADHYLDRLENGSRPTNSCRRRMVSRSNRIRNDPSEIRRMKHSIAGVRKALRGVETNTAASMRIH